MPRAPRTSLAVLALLLLAPVPDARAAGDAPRRQPVVVAIVVDQLAGWVAEERLPLLPETGGFTRLRREGTWVKQQAYLHAVTETAPGHAALFTGRTPRENGIVANQVWREDLTPPRASSLLEDPTPANRLVPTPAGASRPGVSLAHLDGPTLADLLKERDPRAVVAAVSLKDRGALFGGGRRPNLAVWWDEEDGALVTSSAFAADLPPWVRALAPRLDAPWCLEDATFARRARTPDDQPGESAAELGSRTFEPDDACSTGLAHHPPADRARAGRAFRVHPDADRTLAAIALAAVRELRDPAHPMLVALSFSTNDYVGHAFGPDSWEAWDELRHLDATLAALLADLDRALGPDGYTVVLSGDHGIVPLPEVQARPGPWCAPGGANPYELPCAAGVRISSDAVVEELRRALRDGGVEVPVVARMVESAVLLTPQARALPRAERRRVDALVLAAAARIPGIASAHVVTGGPCPPRTDESVPALVCRATRPGLADYYLVPTPGSFFWRASPGAPAEGVAHGAPYRYDRAVPLLVRHPGAPGGRVQERGVFGDFAATVWYALTGEERAWPYGAPVGLRAGGR
jgi:hypothetical protein